MEIPIVSITRYMKALEIFTSLLAPLADHARELGRSLIHIDSTRLTAK